MNKFRYVPRGALIAIPQTTVIPGYLGYSQWEGEPVPAVLYRGAGDMALLTGVDCYKASPFALYLDVSDYGNEWMFYTPACFEVPTPHGTLCVYDKGDEEYPGVMVDLKEKNIGLAMVEYIPGGEGVTDYDPKHPAEMGRQTAEVVPQRWDTDLYGNDCVSAGFVTRSWPDELHDQDRHLRTFHFGYLDEEVPEDD